MSLHTQRSDAEVATQTLESFLRLARLFGSYLNVADPERIVDVLIERRALSELLAAYADPTVSDALKDKADHLLHQVSCMMQPSQMT